MTDSTRHLLRLVRDHLAAFDDVGSRGLHREVEAELRAGAPPDAALAEVARLREQLAKSEERVDALLRDFRGAIGERNAARAQVEAEKRLRAAEARAVDLEAEVSGLRATLGEVGADADAAEERVRALKDAAGPALALLRRLAWRPPIEAQPQDEWVLGWFVDDGVLICRVYRDGDWVLDGNHPTEQPAAWMSDPPGPDDPAWAAVAELARALGVMS